jgi:hypothetical protein
MQSSLSLLKRGLLGTAAVIIAFVPSLSMVVSADSGSQTCTPPPAQVGVNRPVGADADTYTYNCTTGLWQNAYYTFDPSTGVATPTYSIVYTYAPTSSLYDYPDWIFDAPANSYVEVTETTAQPPTGADVVGAPAPVTTPDSITNTGPNSNNTIDGSGDTGSGSITNTGPNSNNTLGGSSTNNLTDNNTTNASIGNLLNQQAGTGNSIVIGNTTAGNATSGNATNTATDINLLQSASNALGGNALTFVANINGNVNGDLLLDPSTLGTIQPAGSNPAGTNNLTVNNATNAAINNNINLGANSGNATVADNTTGGNATSGSAEAIANVVNLIDSAITSGQSFVGVININGDLNGNIEVSPDLVNQLIASNVPTDTISETGPGSNNAINGSTNSTNTNVTNTNNEGINNNVNATSTSGQANVTNNTTAGNATSGNATNTITAFNLTGSTVVGSNDLLVFVNVSGTWVGMIINAPAGATAAELGGGITQSTSGNNNTTVNNGTNEQINNNITTNANSGNASVSGNTNGGNATSGSADTAVNLLNVENSDLSLSGWFGILFINVFGTWNGSFGPTSAFANLDYSAATGGSGATVPATTQVFRFVPRSSSSTTGSSTTASGNTLSSNTAGNGSHGGSLSALLVADHAYKTAASSAPAPKLQSAAHRNLLLPIVCVTVFILYVIGERAYTIRSRSMKKA